jgi:hypothetical protein
MKSCERNLLCGIPSIGCECGLDKLLLKSFQILPYRRLIIVYNCWIITTISCDEEDDIDFMF